MATVRIKLGVIEIELGDELSSGDRRRLGELQRSVDYLNNLPDGPISGDRHHFADITDAVVQMTNIIRRARASS